MYSSSFEYVPPPPSKRKRGVTNTDKYARSVIRKSRVKGEGYINYKGKMVLPKTVPAEIICNCPKKCNKSISDETKYQIWNSFYSLDSKNNQDIYLQTLIEVKEVKRRKKKKMDAIEPIVNDTPFPDASVNSTQFLDAGVNNTPFSCAIVDNNLFPGPNANKAQLPDAIVNETHYNDSTVNNTNAIAKKSPTNKTKSRTFVYNLKINGRFTPVCKNVFLQVHGVSKDRIERMTTLLVQNKTPVDMRGKNRSGNAIPSNIIYLIHDHISRFEVKETSGSGKPKKYLDARLNISKMYQMFQTSYPDLKDKVKYSFYYKYFKENFNYTFGLPNGDVCSKCENVAVKQKDPHPNLNNNVKSTVPTEMAKELVSSLKSTFLDIISSTSWLDEESKNVTIEKVLSMKTEVGYPRDMLSTDFMETFYAKLELSTESLLKNMLKMSRFLVYNELQKLNRPVEENRPMVDNIYKGPLQSSANYFATKNALVVPMGIMRPPIFDLENPEYLNYGRLGNEIAHEMSHGFENIGLQYDKDGKESHWWSEEMKNKFWMKAKCFVEQYNKYVIDELAEKYVDGQRTLHENIADSTGLKKAFMSYQKYVKENGKEPKLPGMEFTNQQLFFISFAQMKCEVRSKEGYEEYIADSTTSLLQTPVKYRVNGALANSEFFAAVFKCPAGGPMSQEKRCSIW
ncbi:hypothetical protein JTE90_026697 [Oedothorax gibbosus]|uniref:Uncharacterized protein n=1 Tax=Oedothorax gibbosus TaxID=931172 RepID=A0AAV6V0X8_9ARAC|nr:hypothetical protein JTE90_026697 [Oedothorax gibbosus]